MAILAGKGTAQSAAVAGSGIGRDFLDTKYTVTTAGTITDFDINIVTQFIDLKLKVWRINGSNYDFIGESQEFTGLTAGIHNLVLNTGIPVLAGDIIDIWVEGGGGTIGVDADDVDTIHYSDNTDYTTNQAQSNFPLRLDFALSVQVNGTATGGNAINVTSINNFECKQRDSNGQATFTVAGTITGSAASVEYQLDSGAWQLLDGSPTTTFTGDVVVTGQQNITVRISDDTGVTDTVNNVTAAMCIAAWGQSNQAGRGTNLQSVVVDTGKPIPIMYKTGTFSALADPTGTDGSAAGSIWPRIAKQYSDLGIPICVGNVAVGGTLLSQWQPATANYIKITDFATSVGGLELTNCIIGEQDSFAGTAQATVETEMEAIVDALNAAYGVYTYITDIPEGDGGVWDDVTVRAAYDNVITNNAHARFGGDLGVIDIDIGTTPGNDGIHLISDADLTTAGNIVFSSISSSTLSLTATGIPNGSYLTTVFSDSRPASLITSEVVTFTSNTGALTIPTPANTQVYAIVRDNLDPSTSVAPCKGITT